MTPVTRTSSVPSLSTPPAPMHPHAVSNMTGELPSIGAIEIANSIWLDPQTLISDDMMQKVNAVRVYLYENGCQLRGVLADGNCFCHAFLESYRTLSRRVPLLDDSEDQLAFLREQIAGMVEKQDIDRAQVIQQNTEWITASDEGDLLAKVLSIPIRVIKVEKGEEGCGISDMLTFTEPEKPRQDWTTIDSAEKPQEYIFIIDLGGHFVYAQPLGSIDFKKVASRQLKRSYRELPTDQIPKKTESKASRKNKRKRSDSTPIDVPPAKQTRCYFENQIHHSWEELKDLEKEWQSYKYKFAVEHLKIENANRFNEIDWTEFKRIFRENLHRRLMCCGIYHKDQLRMIDDGLMIDYDLAYLVHQRDVLEGALNLIDGNSEKAVELFKKAIEFRPWYLPVWLFLASALYRLKKYIEVVELVDNYRTQGDGDLLISSYLRNMQGDNVFSLYSCFSLLTDECIEENFLQLTHPAYLNTEMHYYLAKAIGALNPTDKRGLANVFYRRGIECGMGGCLEQAVINFEKSRELCPDMSFEDHFSKSLFAVGRIEEAIREIEVAIEQSSDDEQKVKYLNRLIDYYIQCERISEADTLIDDIPKAELSNLMQLCLAYFRAKIKLSFQNPSFLAFKKVAGQFFDVYQQMTYEKREKEAAPWLLRYLELRDGFCHHYEIRGKINVVIQTHQFSIKIFEELIAALEKAFFPRRQLEKGAFFPNWCYDRLYLGYFQLLMLQYIEFINSHNAISENFELSPEEVMLSSQLLSQYKAAEDKIKEKLELFDLRGGHKDQSGILQEHQKLKWVVGFIDDFLSEDKTESGAEEEPSTDAINSKLNEAINNFEEMLESTPDIPELYHASLKEAQSLGASCEDNFFQLHSILMSDRLNLREWPRLIKLLQCKDTDESTLVNSFEAIDRTIGHWLSILMAYQEIVEKEPRIFLKNAHLKSLSEYQLFFFPFISEILLGYFNRLKESKCLSSAPKAVKHIQTLLTPLKTLRTHEELPISKRQRLDHLFKALDEALVQVGSMASQRSITEIGQQLISYPLDLLYGKSNSPYRVAFPSQQIIEGLRQLKQTKGVVETKNLSTHYLTIVYRNPPAEDGTKGPRKTVHLPLNPSEEFFTADYLDKPEKNIFDRTQQGHKIHKEVPDKDRKEVGLFSFNDSAVARQFSAYDHRHSEQTFFEWINRQPVTDLITKLERADRDFRPGIKIHMVAFDFGSSYGSCINCRLAALSLQSGKQGNGDFLTNLQKTLLEKGYKLSGKGDGLKLKAVTRILAEVVRLQDQANPHTNPIERNVKHLKNIGLFQHVIPNVFTSGSSWNVKK